MLAVSEWMPRPPVLPFRVLYGFQPTGFERAVHSLRASTDIQGLVFTILPPCFKCEEGFFTEWKQGHTPNMKLKYLNQFSLQSSVANHLHDVAQP